MAPASAGAGSDAGAGVETVAGAVVAGAVVAVDVAVDVASFEGRGPRIVGRTVGGGGEPGAGDATSGGTGAFAGCCEDGVVVLALAGPLAVARLFGDE